MIGCLLPIYEEALKPLLFSVSQEADLASCRLV